MGNEPIDPDADNAQQCFPDPIRRKKEWRVLGQEDIDWLNSVAVCRRYEPGEFVFLEGDACQGVYLIREGLVAVRKSNVDGEAVLLRLANFGDLMGYRPFLAGEPHRATAEVQKLSNICFIKSSFLRDLLLTRPALGAQLLKQVSRDLGDAEQRFHDAVTMSLRERLAHWLLVMKEPYGTETADGKIILDLPISRHDMAEMLGVRSESLSRTIHQMSEDGVLRFSGHRAWIDNPDKLINELSPYLVRSALTGQ